MIIHLPFNFDMVINNIINFHWNGYNFFPIIMYIICKKNNKFLGNICLKLFFISQNFKYIVDMI
jgi:hypothetical protein